MRFNQKYVSMKLNKPNGIGSSHFVSGGFYYGEWKNYVIHGFVVYYFNVGGDIKENLRKDKPMVIVSSHIKLDSYIKAIQRIQTMWGMHKLVDEEKRLTITNFSIDCQHRYIKIFEEKQKQLQGWNKNEEPQLKEDIQIALENHWPQIVNHNDRIVYGLQIDLTGFGVIQYNNGGVEMGWFQNGSLNGRGKIIFKSGDTYDGLLKNGFFQGQGNYCHYTQDISLLTLYNSQQLTEGQFESNQILTIQKQIHQYSKYKNEGILVVDKRILIKNIHLKPRLMIANKQQHSSEKTPNKDNKIQNLVYHMLYPKKKYKKQNSGQLEVVIDNLLSWGSIALIKKNLRIR